MLWHSIKFVMLCYHSMLNTFPQFECLRLFILLGVWIFSVCVCKWQEGSFRALSTLIIFIFFYFYLQFKEITYGLQRTNASTLLRSCLEYVMNYYNRFLPGEGGYLLDLLQNVSTFEIFYCARKRRVLFLWEFPELYVIFSTASE